MHVCSGRPRSRFACGLLIAVLQGCGGSAEEGATPGFTVRDSAEVTIVESTDSAWTETTRWRIATEPDLVIGSVDGSVPGTDFGAGLGVVSLPSGIAVLNSQTDDIRIFDAAGQWLRTVGGKGVGPNEFSFLFSFAATPGDSVAGWDYSLRKMLTFPAQTDGEPRYHTTPSRTHAGRFEWELKAWLSDGRYLLGAADDPRERAQGTRLMTEALVLYSPEGDSLDAFGPYPAYRMETMDAERMYRHLLSRAAITRVSEGTIWRGMPDDGFEVHRIDVETGARRIVRRSFEPITPPTGLRERGLRIELEGYPGAPQTVLDAMRAMWTSVPIVEHLPAYLDLRVAPDGHLWLSLPADPREIDPEDHPFLNAYETSRWSVIDPEGRWLGTAQLPDHFDLHEVGSGWILGTETDDLGVVSVVRYPVLRP